MGRLSTTECTYLPTYLRYAHHLPQVVATQHVPADVILPHSCLDTQFFHTPVHRPEKTNTIVLSAHVSYL